MMRIATYFVVCLLGLLGLGCRASSDFMRPAAPQAIAPDTDAATVVFVRPSGYAGGIVTTILDQRGRFLGDAEAKSHFAVKFPPGEHVFVAWSEGTPALRASLAPGRIYYVEVAPKMGAWSARVQLLAVTPRSENWAKLPGWLAETQPRAPDEAGGTARNASRVEEVQETLRKGAEVLREYDAEELSARTLRPDDGVTGPIGHGSALLPASPGVVAAAGGPPAPPSSPGAGPAPDAAPAAPGAPAPSPADSPSTPAPAAGADLVLLKGGGRVRGKVMEDEPAGVSVLLADGTVRRVARSEVERVEYSQPR